MEIKFIKVKTLSESCHVLRVDKLHYITPKISGNNAKNKSEIYLLATKEIIYSPETPEEILNKINQ